MQNGVFFRLALEIPRKAVAGWKKAKLRDQLARIPGDHGQHEGGELLGGELTVEGKTLKAALGTLKSMGMELGKRDVAFWETTNLEGKPHIRIETKGALDRDATVKQLLDHLEEQTDLGEELVRIERDGKDGRVEIWGYLGGFDAYSDHFFPCLILGAAAPEVGGKGELVFLGDVELRDESVLVRATFSKKGVEITDHPEPQDVTDDEIRQLEAGLGPGGAQRIQEAHRAWLGKLGLKKRRRMFAGRVGWLRPDGSFAIEPRFRAAGGFAEGLAAVSESGPAGYGYIDEAGKLVIPHRFFSANGFKSGRACVKIETGRERLTEFSARISYAHGYIDRRGEWAVPPRYAHAEDFSEERAVIGDDELRGYVDLDGREIAAPKYRTALAFADGLALVAEHDKYGTGGFGFLDRDGNVAIPLGLERAGTFHRGFAPASRDGAWGFLEPSGKWLIEPRFQETGYLVDDRALARLDGKWGLIDRAGRTLIPFAHLHLRQLGEWFVARGGDESIFFSRDGAELFRVPYDVLGEPRDGLLGVARSYHGPFGYIDFEGRVRIEPRFRFAAPFSDGLAIVEDESGKWGIVERSGKMTTRFPFRLLPSAGASHFAKNGLAYIENTSRFGLVNRAGRVIHPPELEAMFGFGEDLIWARYPEDLD